MSKHLSLPVSLSVLNTLRPGDVVHDPKLPGFGARRQKNAVSYFLKFRIEGRQRWVTIGRHGAPWTPETARKRALQIMANPHLADKPVATAANTFAAVSAQFITKHGPKLKPRTLVEYERMIDKYLVPALGAHPVAAITRAHISTAHATWAETPRTGNFALTVLSKFMTWAEDEGLRPDGTNPVRRIPRYKENTRDRFLTAAELGALGAAIDKAERENLVGPFVSAALRLLILTGARLSEVLTLEWAHVDLERRMLFLPDSKTGQKPIILADAAVDILTAIPRLAGNPYVIAGKNNGQHLKNLQKPWYVVRKLAGLDGLRLHDLRHTFASFAVGSGGSLPIIGRALGHSQPSTTQRYAHLADDPVRKLTETTGALLASALKGKPKE